MFNRQMYFLIIFVHIIVLVRLIKVISNLVCGSINERSMIFFRLKKMTTPEKILQYGRGKICSLPIKGRIRLYMFRIVFYFQLRTFTCKLQAITFEWNTWDMAPLGHALFSLNITHRYILLYTITFTILKLWLDTS